LQFTEPDVKIDDIIIVEKKTFRFHIIAQIFSGLSTGIATLQDIILKKSLDGTDFQILLLSLFIHSAFLASLYGAEIINRSSNFPKTVFKFGVLAKIFLILIPIVNSPVYYIFCISVTAYLDSMMLSSWNIVFRHNYTEDRRSKLYAYASTIATVMLLFSSTIIGVLLDRDNTLFRIFFPVSGIMGIIMYYYLSKMLALSTLRIPEAEIPVKSAFSLQLVKDVLALPLRITKKIFIENKPFLRFEIYFFLYGMAFMVIMPAIPIFVVDILNLSYTPISIAKGFLFNFALILFTPLMGKYIGSGNPTKFCGYTFLILTLFPLILISAELPFAINIFSDRVYVVYLAYIVFGIGMSGISIAWTLGSLYYAPRFEVSNYQAVHIALTGVRGVFSPALGYAVMKIFSIEYTFILSAFLFLCGGLFMLMDERLFGKKTES
jgi:MFS family permease